MIECLGSKAPISACLNEGQPVLLRPIEPGDRDRARLAYRLLSERSRMNRFWAKPMELSDAWADRLTQDDEGRHIAWIAISPNENDVPGYGGASLWRDEDNESRAEISFTIADEWQRCGLASLLFSLLYFDGWHQGIRQLYGFCRLDNAPMVGWWKSIGGTIETTGRQHELFLALEAPSDFINRVSFEMPPSVRRVDVAHSLQEWESLLQGEAEG